MKKFFSAALVIFSLIIQQKAFAANWGEGTWGQSLWSSVAEMNVPIPFLATAFIFLACAFAVFKTKRVKNQTLLPAFFCGLLVSINSIEANAQFSVPNQFTNGTTIDAAEMNANFQAIVDEINSIRSDTSASGSYTVHMLVAGHNGEPSGDTDQEFGNSLFTGTVSVVVTGGTCSVSGAVSGSFIELPNLDLGATSSAFQADGFTPTFTDCIVGMNGTIIAKWQLVDVANEGGGSGLAVGVKISN